MKTLFLAVFLCNMYKYSHNKNLSWIKITILTTLHNTRAISRTCVERRVRTGCQVVKTSAGRFKRPGEPTFVSRATIVKLHNRPNSVYKVAEKHNTCIIEILIKYDFIAISNAANHLRVHVHIMIFDFDLLL